MSFNPKRLPPTVYKVYQFGASMWILTVVMAIQMKIKDIDLLADIAFYLHHPELKGRSLRHDEIKLIAEWKSYRTLIKRLLKEPGTSSGSTPFVGGWGSSQYQYGFEGTY